MLSKGEICEPVYVHDEAIVNEAITVINHAAVDEFDAPVFINTAVIRLTIIMDVAKSMNFWPNIEYRIPKTGAPAMYQAVAIIIFG